MDCTDQGGLNMNDRIRQEIRDKWDADDRARQARGITASGGCGGTGVGPVGTIIVTVGGGPAKRKNRLFKGWSRAAVGAFLERLTGVVRK